MASTTPSADSQQFVFLVAAVLMEKSVMATPNGQQKGSRNLPTERLQLTETLKVAVWRSEDRNGAVRFNWDLSRVAEDGSRTFDTMVVSSLLELPAFTAKLSELFANSSSVPQQLRERLAAQSVALYECIEAIEASSEPKANGRAAESNRVFA